MKKFIIVFALLIGLTSFVNTIEAQNINISINIGRQPAWGPVGYDYAGYYYFPDIDIYYDVNVGLFYYLDRGRWISARYLPYAYRNYDLYRLYKVVLNVNQPWRYHHKHYRDYARYRGHRSPVVIRDSRDVRYRDSRNNRVAWYSSDKKHANKKHYNNSNNRDRNYSNNKKANDNRKRNENYRSDNHRKDNNKNTRPGNNYNSGRDNKKANNNKNVTSRQDRNRSDKNYSSPRNSNKENSRNNQVKRNSSSNRSGELRMASNTKKGGRTR